ncbi:MAG: hypothetical protein JSV91_02250, partial [Phycisphaerales bacterium]
GQTFALYDTSNSPLPYGIIRGIDVRDDGLVGLSAYGNTGQGTAALIDGDPGNPASWSVYLYGDSPLPHWQLDAVAFDADGDLWISALSEGVAVIEVGMEAIPGDVNNDGVVDIDDVFAVLAAWGPCAACPEDVNGDGFVDIDDLFAVLANWT